MITAIVDDSDRHGYLNQSIVLEILNKNGFPATIKTLTKYANLGLMMLPKAKRFRKSNNNSRTYYCPLSIIEFMTAYLLARGDYKELKSSKRIAHFTMQEIFAGRTEFFYKKSAILSECGYIPENGAFNYQSYEFLWPNQNSKKPDKTSNRIYMKEIDYNHIVALENYLAGFYESEELGRATAKYNALLYEETFQALYHRYIKEILNPQEL